MVDFPKVADTASPEPNNLNTAALVGAGMREVRERLGWKLPDVAERIRIRSIFLIAIEEGDLSDLPGTAYRVGFVRSYAQALGLDGEEILRRFRDAGQIDAVEKNKLKLLVPVPDRGVPKGALIFIAFVVTVGGYGLWYHQTEQTRKIAQSALPIPAKLQPLTTPPKVTPTLPPAVVSKSQPEASASTPPANIPSASPSALVSSSSGSTVSSGAPVASPPPSAAASPARPINAAAPAAENGVNPPAVVAPAATALGSAPSLVDTTSTPASAKPSQTDTGLVITATQPSWIQVTAANGTILFSKVLNAGQSWPVPQMPGLKMTTGNAGGTLLSVGNEAGQPLGAVGAVLHNYQLTPPAQSSSAPLPSSNTPAAAP